MTKLQLICVDDQPEVLRALLKDLDIFLPYCVITDCLSSDEAMSLLEELDQKGEPIALIISDHVMPGKNGVELLTDIKKDHRFKKIKKLLLTGLATQSDTILAINQAKIDHYLEKPWKPELLIQIVKKLLTEFMIQSGLPTAEYQAITDQQTLLENMRLFSGE